MREARNINDGHISMSIADLKEFSESILLSIFLALPRVYAFLLTAQIFTQTSMTRTGRVGVVLMLCMPISPLIYTLVPSLNINAQTLLPFLFKEFVIGYLFGYTIGWLLWAVQAVGMLIDNQRGASIAESMDPLQGHQSSPLGNLFSQAFITYLFTTGGILYIISILYYTYEFWPPTRLLPVVTESFPELAIGILDHGMRLMFVFAGPIVGIMFLAEFSLAMVSRFAPQIQVFILAMPIKSALAIFILIFYVNLFIPEAERKKGQAYDFAAEMMRIFERGDIFSPSPSGETPPTEEFLKKGR